MQPKNAVYLRAQAAILWSSKVSVREMAKILLLLGSKVDEFTRVLRHSKKVQKRKFYEKNLKTTEEKGSAWICRNSVEICHEKESSHFWATTNRTELAWYSLANIVKCLQQMNGKTFSLAMNALNTFSIFPTLKPDRMGLTGKLISAIVQALQAMALLCYILSCKDKL